MITSISLLLSCRRVYLAFLRAHHFTETICTNMQPIVLFFDTVRFYQEVLDPSACFLIAWLPDGVVMRQGIVADFLRQSNGWGNQLFESLLIRSENKIIFMSYYKDSERTLLMVNRIMDVIFARK
jgi:hypothetical protein